MDVAALSVSIDIDMSGFMEAMEELLALIETMIQQLDTLEQRIGNFKQAGDTFYDIVDALSDLYDFGEDLVKGAENWVSYIKAVLDAIKAFRDIKKVIDDTKGSADNLNQTLGNNSGAASNGGNQVWTYNPETKGYDIPSSGSQDNTGGGASSEQLETFNNNVGTSSGSSSATFATSFYDNLKMISDLMPKVNADIKIHASAVLQAQGGYGQLNQFIQQNVVNLNKETDANNKAGEAARKHIDILKELGAIGKSALSGLGAALGDIVTSKKNPLAGLFKMLASAVKQLGEYLIGIGTGTAVLGIGAAYIAGGVALEALGAIIGSKATKMAAGGLVSGSSFVNVGEYAGASHNPEVIAPLDRLRNMMGGGTQNHTFEIQGDKLVSILQRVDNNNSFALGQ